LPLAAQEVKMDDKISEQNDWPELGFDFEKARKSVITYSHATGTECFLIDSKGNILFESNNGPKLCKYCRDSQHLLNKEFSCQDVHLYGCYQAERFGGKYVFFCPIGLTHWISPITKDKTICGALIGGPVLMVDPEEFMLDDLLNSNSFEIKSNEFAQFVKNIQVTQPEVVNDLSELLLIVASHIAFKEDEWHKELIEKNSVQAKISESLQGIKSSYSPLSTELDYPFEKERELLTSISLGDRSTSQRILNDILGNVFFSSGMDFNVIKARIQELTVLLSRAAIEGGADVSEIFGLNFHYLSDINSFNTVEELTFWLSKILARFTDCVFNLAGVRHKDIIYKAVDYIRKNYMNKLTMIEVAKFVYLNPSYFSKIFKSEIGCSFVSYVNNLRIEKSKDLLFDISVPLTDISSLMGFEEQSYYTKVFKKMTGMTPGEFRKSRGRKTVTKS
jgi:AraC-like DNA-binding protein/ligand-binding sensor protein